MKKWKKFILILTLIMLLFTTLSFFIESLQGFGIYTSAISLILAISIIVFSIKDSSDN